MPNVFFPQFVKVSIIFRKKYTELIDQFSALIYSKVSKYYKLLLNEFHPLVLSFENILFGLFDLFCLCGLIE